MHRKQTSGLKFLTLAGLLAGTGLVMVLSGVSLVTALLFLCSVAVILFWFTRKPRPDDEQPCSAVSCCHYLEEQNDGRPPHPREEIE